MTNFLQRVMSSSEIIGAAFKVLRKRWDVMLACIIPVFLPLLVLRWVTDGQVSQLLSYALGLATPVAGAIAAVVVDEEPNGGATISRVFDRLRGRWPAVIAVAFIQSIVTAVGFMLLIIPGIIVTLMFAVTPVALVLEREHDIFGAFRRSRDLAKDQWGHIFATQFLAWLVVAAICLLGLAVSTPLIAVFGIRESGLFASRGVGFLYGVGYTALQTLVGLVGAILYFDLRARQSVRVPGMPSIAPKTEDKVSS